MATASILMSFKGTARFQVLDKLGEGGMGIVYEAYDRARDMRVALKTLRNVDATSLYRFKREFRALSDISHPNIITLYELFSEQDEWFFTMELIDGQDFLSYVQGERATATARSGLLGDADTRTATLMLTNQAMDQAVDATAPVPAPASSPATTPATGLPHVPAQRPVIADVVAMDRLRDAVGQLARALHVLHAAGLVHRDLKPSNVRITPAGRVVLMDFGMVAETRPRVLMDSTGSVMGTPGFMAPEQLADIRPTAAADWYALGVILYVSLTDRLPYEGSIMEVMEAKRSIDPRPARLLVDGIPPDLERLCMDLLHRDPDQRPSGAQVLARLGALEADPVNGGAGLVLDLGMRHFVGRTRELAALHAAYRAVCADRTRCLLVQGPSGIGKTTLIERFLHDLHTASGAVPLVLTGRCHERESLPYKAFDGVMDSLTSSLIALPEEPRAAVMPADMALIARLFPVLHRVPGADQGAPDASRNPLELRSRAVAALRALLQALSRERPMVLYLEDLQWADRESFDLLLSLLQPHAIPRLLVIATLRSEDVAGHDQDHGRESGGNGGDASRSRDASRGQDEGTRILRDSIRGLEEQAALDHVVLGPLSDSEQRDLVETLAATNPDVLARVDAQVWQDAEGNPMLVAELARYAQMVPEAIDGEPTRHLPPRHLEDLIWQRIQLLPEPARILMEILAVAGEPTPLRVLVDASGLSRIEGERAASILRIVHLARTSRTDAVLWLDAYHDKVREAVARKLAPAHARDLHRALARSLDAWGQASVVVIARHRLAAGDRHGAARYFLDAARHAGEQLALDRAAELYRTALALLPQDSPQVSEAPSPQVSKTPSDEGAPDASSDASCGDLDDQELARLRCRAWIGLAEGMRIVDRSDEAMALLDQAVELATAQELIQELATIHYLRGNLLFPRGDFDGCLAEHATARAFARLARSPEREAQALSGLGDAYYMRGRMISAHQHFSMCIDICREHGFTDIEVANLSMRGMTRYYRNDLAAALRDSEAAAAAAAARKHHRAEIVARNGCVGWILVEMGQLERARHELERALDMARTLGARRFEPNSLTWLGKIAALTGARAQAQAMVERSVATCRATGFAFVGPMALGALALVTPDPGVRARALAEGEEVLRSGSASHNYLYFYRDAMDALLAAGDVDGVERCADALEHYTRLEPLPWSRFFIERARALARLQRDPDHAEAHATAARLRTEALNVGLRLAARALTPP